MKPLPDILTSAGFWASIATLWSAAGAWFTFVGTVKASKQQTYEAILNLLSGIEAELALVEQWAAGKEGEVGYLQKDPKDLAKEHTDWFNPSRQIFTFNTPTIRDFTNSPYVRYLSPIVTEVVRLNHSIQRLFDYMKMYQAFVFAKPELYQAVFASVSGGKMPANEGRVFANVVFEMNLRMHQNLIGGLDCPDEDCLYKTFRRARKAVGDFKRGLRPEPLPKWYWILHVTALFLALNGVWQVARWLSGLWR